MNSVLLTCHNVHLLLLQQQQCKPWLLLFLVMLFQHLQGNTKSLKVLKQYNLHQRCVRWPNSHIISLSALAKGLHRLGIYIQFCYQQPNVIDT